MKKLLTTLLVLSTISAHAMQLSGVSALGSFFSSGGNICKEAVQVVEDVNAFNSTGELSVFLSAKIEAVKTANPDLSDAEAVDLLVSASEQIIAENSK